MLVAENSDRTPTVSVIVPCYRAASFVEETIDALSKQTFTDWEMIAIEDGVADGAEDIVRAFGARVQQPVRFLKHAQNRGLSATRNTAFIAARGRWLALLDADDLWLPEHLERGLHVAEHERAEIVFGGSLLFDNQSGRDLAGRVPSETHLRSLPHSLFRNDFIIQPSSVIFTKRLVEKVGGFETLLRSVEDLDFYFRVLRAGFRLSYVGAITCRYRKHAEALSARALPMSAFAADVYARQSHWKALPHPLRRRRIGSAFKSAGRIASRQRPFFAVLSFWRGLRANPHDWSHFAYAFATMLRSLLKRANGLFASTCHSGPEFGGNRSDR